MFKSALNQITPYTPGKSVESIKKDDGLTDIIKLASNENPLGAAVDFASVSSNIERYPDYTTHPFVGELSNHLNATNQQLILGNGSDEILQIIALALISPGDEILSASCTFSEYKFVAQITGATYVEAAMDQHTYSVNNLINAITPRTKIIFIANPNNPTGTILTHAQIEQLMAATSPNTLVVLDEAYAEYVTNTSYPKSIALIKKYPNLLVTRTFSKIYGLAALRIGYGMAQEQIIEGLQKVRQPFNVNGLALACGLKALQNQSFVQHSIQINNEGKAFLKNKLNTIDCVIPPSEGNFLYIEFKTINGIQLCENLLERGIIVRSMKSFGQNNAIRVTIGTLEQNQRFIKELHECLKKQS
jgi:histidinol-phosphate aminotransferase